MLYLIKEYGKENKEYIKIGKADNVNKRMKQYNTHCAEFELIDSFKGSEIHENLLHSLLKKYIIKNEWMEYNEEIIITWKLYKQLYNIIEAQENLEIKNLKNTLAEVVEAYEEEKYLFNYCIKLFSNEQRLKMKDDMKDVELKYTKFI